MPLLPAKLLSSAGAELPVNAAIPVDPGGTTLAFEIPADSELVAAALTLVAPGDDRTIDLLAGPAAATLASSQGAGPPPGNLAVTWLTADWRSRRPLVAVAVAVSNNPAPLGTLKLSEDGPWYPPNPSRLTLGPLQRLPALYATRLLVEFATESNGVLTPTSAIVTSVALQAAARPGDLTVSLADAPVASHALAFDPREAWLVEPELLTALQSALADRGGPVKLRLRSSEPGLLDRLTLRLDRVPRIRQFATGPTVTAALVADATTEIPIALPADAAVDSLAFTVRTDLPAERPAVAIDADPPGPHAHRVSPDRSAAQALRAAPGALLVGLDLHLRALTPAIQATVAIHADESGLPAAAPLLTIPLDRVLADDPPWPTEWWHFDVPAGFTLPDATWWVSLSVTRGDLLWHLDTRPIVDAPGAPLPQSSRWRHAADAWLLREVPGPGPVRALVVPWARTRVRLAADPAALPTPTLHLHHRGAQLPLTLDPNGRVTVSRAQLAPLDAAPSGPLTLRVASTVAGSVTASDLELRLARVRDTLTLGLA